MATTELNNKSVVKGKNGGARPGAGRKPGKMEQATLDKIRVLEAYKQKILANADELFELQMGLARKGDGKAINDMLDRAFGKAQDFMDITSKGNELGLTPQQAEQLIRARANRSDS